jgi:hypothetical protein
MLTFRGRTPCHLRNAKDFFLGVGASGRERRTRSGFLCNLFYAHVTFTHMSLSSPLNTPDLRCVT